MPHPLLQTHCCRPNFPPTCFNRPLVLIVSFRCKFSACTGTAADTAGDKNVAPGDAARCKMRVSSPLDGATCVKPS